MLSIGPVRYNEILFSIFIIMTGQCLSNEKKKHFSLTGAPPPFVSDKTRRKVSCHKKMNTDCGIFDQLKAEFT